MSNNLHHEFHDIAKLEPNLKHSEIVERLAKKHGMEIHQAAAECKQIEFLPSYAWPPLLADKVFSEEGDYTKTSIYNIIEKDNLGKLVKGVSDMLRFPKDSAALHAISCIASAMTIKKMRFQAGRWNGPTNLYTIISQPPSTAKSAVNDLFSGVIDDYVMGEMTELAHNKIKELKIQKREMEKKAKSAGTPREQAEIEQDIAEIDEDIKAIRLPLYAITDTTPEALQMQAAKQGGWFALVTAEQGLINKMFGMNYGTGKSPDMDFVLQSFTSDKSTSIRVSREALSARSTGSVAILAQDIGIKNMIKMGETGQGMPERFLFLREKSLLGYRNRREEVPYPEKNVDWYQSFIKELLSQDEGRTLVFDDECRSIVNEKMQDYEEHMQDGGRYGSSFLQGVIGKGDGQIYRLASILHTVRSFKSGKLGSAKVSKQSVVDAINIYDQLKDAIVDVATEQGIAGDEAVLRACIDVLRELSTTRKAQVLPNGVKVIRLNQLREAKKNTKPFSGYSQLSKVLNQAFEALSALGVCAYHEKTIYISPRLFD